jgi:hypothetical protein
MEVAIELSPVVHHNEIDASTVQTDTIGTASDIRDDSISGVDTTSFDSGSINTDFDDIPLVAAVTTNIIPNAQQIIIHDDAAAALVRITNTPQQWHLSTQLQYYKQIWCYPNTCPYLAIIAVLSGLLAVFIIIW